MDVFVVHKIKKHYEGNYKSVVGCYSTIDNVIRHVFDDLIGAGEIDEAYYSMEPSKTLPKQTWQQRWDGVPGAPTYISFHWKLDGEFVRSLVIDIDSMLKEAILENKMHDFRDSVRHLVAVALQR